MGWVGTVCITAQDGEPLVTRRYAAAAHAGPASVLHRMMADVQLALEQNPALHVGVVQDGAPQLWSLMNDALRTVLKVPGRGWGIHAWKRLPWRETIDWYHLMERLGAALKILVKSDSVREGLLDRFKQMLSGDDRAIRTITRWLTIAAARRPSKELNDVIGCYFIAQWRFRYASLSELGLQKGSGVTEGACKSLITKRTKRSGQRWRPRGISAVLALRSLLESDRLERFWDLFTPRYSAVCLAA